MKLLQLHLSPTLSEKLILELKFLKGHFIRALNIQHVVIRAYWYSIYCHLLPITHPRTTVKKNVFMFVYDKQSSISILSFNSIFFMIILSSLWFFSNNNYWWVHAQSFSCEMTQTQDFSKPCFSMRVGSSRASYSNLTLIGYDLFS